MWFNLPLIQDGFCILSGGNKPWSLWTHQEEHLLAQDKPGGSTGHHTMWMIASWCCGLGLLWLGGYSHTQISHTQRWLSLRRQEAEIHIRGVHLSLPTPLKVNGCIETVSLQGHLLAPFLSTRSFGRENNKCFPVEGFFFWHLMPSCSYMSTTCLFS